MNQKATQEAKRKRGRPRRGEMDAAGKPELISEYPKLAVYMRPDLKNQLTAAAVITGIPAWKLVNLAIEKYLREELSRADRAALTVVADRVAANQ